MKQLLITLLLLSGSIHGQENLTMEVKINLGKTPIGIYSNQVNTNDSIIFLNVHEDEATSIETLHEFADSISFFYLRHQQTRRIEFELDGTTYSVDPNRIFTKKGRKKTLKDGGEHKRKANKKVKKLAREITNRLPNGYTVVAVHNNTDVNYSIKSYLPGGDEAQNTAKIHVTDKMDADDFIYTTDLKFYKAFKKKDINVILQDNKGYVNDGSLSVYCGKRGIPYINIETQKGHLKEQLFLMQVVLDVIQEEGSK